MKAFSALMVSFCVLAMTPAGAGEYTVSPFRLEFDRDAKSGEVTLANTGQERIDFQIRIMEWKQDEAGKDRYGETGEIVFFPRILSLEPSQERVIRVGIKVLPIVAERAFRLFIEELPKPNAQPLPPGANLAINLRFALPIFAKPPVHAAKGEIVSASVSRGQVALALRNAGNEHYRMDEGIVLKGRSAQGKEVFAHALADRYVLAGVDKHYTVAVPRQACSELATLEITVNTAAFTLSRIIDVSRANCE